MICFNIAGFLAKPGFLWYCFLFRTAKESFSLLLLLNGNENMKTNKTRIFLLDGPSGQDKKLTKVVFKDIPNNWGQNPRKLKIYIFLFEGWSSSRCFCQQWNCLHGLMSAVSFSDIIVGVICNILAACNSPLTLWLQIEEYFCHNCLTYFLPWTEKGSWGVRVQNVRIMICLEIGVLQFYIVKLF